MCTNKHRLLLLAAMCAARHGHCAHPSRRRAGGRQCPRSPDIQGKTPDVPVEFNRVAWISIHPPDPVPDKPRGVRDAVLEDNGRKVPRVLKLCLDILPDTVCLRGGRSCMRGGRSGRCAARAPTSAVRRPPCLLLADRVRALFWAQTQITGSILPL